MTRRVPASIGATVAGWRDATKVEGGVFGAGPVVFESVSAGVWVCSRFRTKIGLVIGRGFPDDCEESGIVYRYVVFGIAL